MVQRFIIPRLNLWDKFRGVGWWIFTSLSSCAALWIRSEMAAKGAFKKKTNSLTFTCWHGQQCLKPRQFNQNAKFPIKSNSFSIAPALLSRILLIFLCFPKESHWSPTYAFHFEHKCNEWELPHVLPGVWATVLSGKSMKDWQWEYQGSPARCKWRSRSVPLPRSHCARLQNKCWASVCFLCLARQTLPEVCSEQDELDFLMEALIIRWDVLDGLWKDYSEFTPSFSTQLFESVQKKWTWKDNCWPFSHLILARVHVMEHYVIC